MAAHKKHPSRLFPFKFNITTFRDIFGRASPDLLVLAPGIFAGISKIINCRSSLGCQNVRRQLRRPFGQSLLDTVITLKREERMTLPSPLELSLLLC